MNKLEFLVEKEKVMAQWKLLEELVNILRYTDKTYKEALDYEIGKVWDKIENLRSIEERNKR